MNLTKTTGLAIAALLGLVISNQARAQSASGRSGVHDKAGLFSAAAVEAADKALADIQHKTKWQAVIETVDSIGDTSPREAAIEHAKQHNIHGVYVLIVKDKHKVWVEPSHSARAAFSDEKCKAIAAAISNAFKAGEFDRGSSEAVSLIRSAAEVEKAESLPLAQLPAPKPVTPAAEGGSSLIPLVIGGVGILFLLWLVSRMFRRPAMQQAAGTNYPAPGYGPGPRPGAVPPPGYGPGGYGAPMPAQGGGGGGFLSGALGGLGGAIAGNILYDKFGRPHDHEGNPVQTPGSAVPEHRGDWSGSGNEDAGAPAESYDPDAGAGADWGGDNANADTGATGDWGGGDADADADTGAGGDWGGDAGAGTDDNQGAGGDW